MQRQGKIHQIIVQDSTRIKDKKTFLATNDTKDSLTLYLAQKLAYTSTLRHMMTATRLSAMTNCECHIPTDVSTQEEADTLMILHAVEATTAGCRADIYSQDTDVLLLAFRRVPQLGGCALIMGTGERRQKVELQPRD
jgi:hypothetical protein